MRYIKGGGVGERGRGESYIRYIRVGVPIYTIHYVQKYTSIY